MPTQTHLWAVPRIRYISGLGARVAERQTQSAQNRPPQGVGVRIPPLAPAPIEAVLCPLVPPIDHAGAFAPSRRPCGVCQGKSSVSHRTIGEADRRRGKPRKRVWPAARTVFGVDVGLGMAAVIASWRNCSNPGPEGAELDTSETVRPLLERGGSLMGIRPRPAGSRATAYLRTEATVSAGPSYWN